MTDTGSALIIGNSKYDEAELTNPGNDAEDIGKTLADSLGWKVTVHKDLKLRDLVCSL